MTLPSKQSQSQSRAMNKEPYRRIRVALLDDHPVVIHGLSSQLKMAPGMWIAGEFTNSRELLASLATQQIDVLLMDYSLGPKEIDGVSLLRMLRARFPSVEVLVVSGHNNAATATLAMRAGARGFIGKTRPMPELIEAIWAVAARKRYIDQSVASDVEHYAKPGGEKGVVTLEGQSSLSPREQEVLRCVLEGMSVGTIAQKFSRSVNTISTQKQAAYRKLGVRSDAELFKIHHSLGDAGEK
jgi:two-component system, NarL family, captular synthesis response regulator RcsB